MLQIRYSNATSRSESVYLTDSGIYQIKKSNIYIKKNIYGETCESVLTLITCKQIDGVNGREKRARKRERERERNVNIACED